MKRAAAEARILDSELLEPKRQRLPEPQRISASRHGMIATVHYRATEAGVEILEEGGNAVDAAVAASLALGVCEPAASGIGGQTMLMVHLAEERRTFALDGSSRAPNRASVETLTKAGRRRGYRATTVPSTLALLDYALTRYGTLPLARVLEPAIRLAEEGFQVTDLQHALTRREAKHLRKHTAAPFFLLRGEKAYPVGSLLKQPVLAATLKRLARRGIADFYTGKIARAIHDDMSRNDGLIQRDDLAQVPRPIERRPLTFRFEGSRVFTIPEPGAGRTLVGMLNFFEHLPEKSRNPDTPRGAMLLAEIIRRANLDRRDRPFDPNYFPQVDERKFLSEDYARLVARQVRARIKTTGETTHLSVMDRHGNAVGLTQSIENVYGSCVVTEELGFLYNNYMSAFDYDDMTHPFYMRPNAVPWASVAPTIVFRGRKPWLVIGSPGSERIASAIFQVLLRLERQPPIDAVSAPRMHCSIDGKVSLEAPRMRDDIPRYLAKRGFTIDAREAYSFYLGCVQLVLRDGKHFIGVADVRRDGSAGGPIGQAAKGDRGAGL